MKEKIEEMGHECNIINASIRGYRIYKYILAVYGERILPNFIQDRLSNLIPAFRIYKSLVNDIKKLNISPAFLSKKMLSKKYDCIIIGSDELWSVENPEMNYIPAYFGIGFDVPVFSYATSGISFGIPSGKRLYNIIQGLSKFLCISVRDDKTFRSISQLRNTNPQISKCVKCIDPTLLNPCFINTSEEQDYILVYGVEFSEIQIKEIVSFSKKTGLKLIGISWKHDFCDEFALVNSANEFEILFSKSKFCITSTFHGTVFSILNHKQFIAFPTEKRLEKISDLLKLLNLSDRLYYDGMQISEMPDINYEAVEQILFHLRKESNQYLQSALRLAGKEK